MDAATKQFLQQCFAEAVPDVFCTMTGLTIDLSDNVVLSANITGVMMLLGEQNALLTLSLTKEDALKVISAMSGTDAAQLNDTDLYDGVAELINMIAGRAKAAMVGTKFYYRITPPFAVAGREYHILYKKQVERFSLYFSAGKIQLELTFTYLT